ncbi:MAG: lamin tail domain-containing protein [Bacteroidetes bacterium]|nr:MAG: lamin tail domain-containing protein [Bacteroidota bacterium]
MKKVMRFFSLIPANLLWVHLLSASIPVDRDTLSSQITAGWGDVVFSEVMFDPDPPVKLPAYEYLEVLNRTGGPLSMSGWSLGVNSRRYLIPGYTLPPGERAILTSDGGIESFGGLPHLVRVFTSGYALPNEGALLSLYNAEGLAVHAARYQVPRGVSSYKTEGGWSLESPDDDPVCLTSVLWDFSVDPSGGTPGAGNSTVMEIIDNEAPVLLFSSAPDRGRMRLTFSEPVWSAGTEWIDVEDTAGRGVQGP